MALRRIVAEFLRTQTPKTVLGIGAACLLRAGIAIAAADSVRVLRPLIHVLGLLLATAVSAIGLGVIRLLAAWPRRHPAERRGKLAASLGFGVAAVLVGSGFCTYSLSFYWKVTCNECWEAGQGRSFEERRAALARGKQRLASVLSVLPELVGFRVSSICAGAERDIQRMERGSCAWFPVRDVPCRCGGQVYPRDAECEHSRCAVRQSPERLTCD